MPTMATPAGRINNKHLTFSLIKRDADEEKEVERHYFNHIFSVTYRYFVTFLPKPPLPLDKLRLHAWHLLLSWNCFPNKLSFKSITCLFLAFIFCFIVHTIYSSTLTISQNNFPFRSKLFG